MQVAQRMTADEERCVGEFGIRRARRRLGALSRRPA